MLEGVTAYQDNTPIRRRAGMTETGAYSRGVCDGRQQQDRAVVTEAKWRPAKASRCNVSKQIANVTAKRGRERAGGRIREAYRTRSRILTSPLPSHPGRSPGTTALTSGSSSLRHDLRPHIIPTRAQRNRQPQPMRAPSCAPETHQIGAKRLYRCLCDAAPPCSSVMERRIRRDLAGLPFARAKSERRRRGHLRNAKLE